MPVPCGERGETFLRAIEFLRPRDDCRQRKLAVLRESLAQIEGRSGGSRAMGQPLGERYFSLGSDELDRRLGGGLPRAALHEIHAPYGADASSADGFALGLALRAAQDKPLFWIRQDFVEGEAGRLNGLGLAEFGVNPAKFILARGRDVAAVLRAAAEAARCQSLGSVLIEVFGAPRALDLTASLRLARATEKSGVALFLLRIGAGEVARAPPSAAFSRWSVRAQASRALLANAPGAPCFSVSLSRHRDGVLESSWSLEWRRDQALFALVSDRRAAALSGSVSAFSADRGFDEDRRRAG